MSLKDHYEFYTHRNESVSLIPKHSAFKDELRRYIQYLHDNSSHFHSQMHNHGLSPATDPMQWLGDMPNTTKEDYKDILQLEALSTLNRDPFVADLSSGSTAQCVLRLTTNLDELGEQEITQKVFKRAGMQAGDHFVCIEVGAPEIYDFYFRASRHLGVHQNTLLHLTNNLDASLKPLKELAPEFVLTIPSVLVTAWPVISKIWPHGQSPIRSLVHMGEPMHPDFKKTVSETLGCKIYSFYGTTEIGGYAGECEYGVGCHFDPSMTLPTVSNVKWIDENTVEGEAFFTTLYIRTQSVVKYQVGDLIRLTLDPCKCGEATPRLQFLERTKDSFIMMGIKFRYETVFEAFKEVDEEIRNFTITLENQPSSKNHCLITISMDEKFKEKEDAFLNILRTQIFELDDLYKFGFAEFQMDFTGTKSPDNRKTRKVYDLRKYMTDV